MLSLLSPTNLLFVHYIRKEVIVHVTINTCGDCSSRKGTASSKNQTIESSDSVLILSTTQCLVWYFQEAHVVQYVKGSMQSRGGGEMGITNQHPVVLKAPISPVDLW